MYASDQTSLLGSDKSLVGSGGYQQPSYTKDNALYHDSSQTPIAKCMQLAFAACLIVLVLVSVILGIYRGTQYNANMFEYLLLNLNLLGFMVIELLLMYFIRNGELPKEKTWFLYCVGFCIMLEAVLTDIMVYN